MKILIIIGSPKGKGNTYNTVKKVEEQITKLDKTVEFEYLLLKNANLQTCKGCFQCLKKGEEYCPIKDEQRQIEDKMINADGVIFAAPVYVYNVPWIMKNFIDRFAYISHRPHFNGKHAMTIVTTGAVGLNFVLSLLSFEIGTWGFSVTQKLGVICPPGKVQENDSQKLHKNTEKHIAKAARKFYNSLTDNSLINPSFIKLISFNLQKYAFFGSDKTLADYKYWENKGWLKSSTQYYYPVKINFIKKSICKLIVKVWYLNTLKPSDLKAN